MHVTSYAWIITVAVMVTVLAIDVLIIGRRPHEPSMKECGIFISIYVLLAIIFGFGVWGISGPQYAGEFFAGWLTEYSLSVDNLFIFIIIMAKLKVPRHLQQFALIVGIVLALIFRGAFIAAGAAAIQSFSWVFFLFGAFLIYTAIKLVIEYRQGDDVRRVHWRSTARRGELMVRREEQAWDPSVTLILDSRARAHGGPGRESSFEYAVSCAASIAMHFVEHGFAVHLYDAQGDMLPRDTDRTFSTTSQHVLHCFTDVQPAPLRDLSEGLQSSLLGAQGQLIVAVTGRLTPTDAEALLRTRRNRAHGLAVVLDVDSFVSRSERADEEARAAHEQAVQMLRNQMWRVAEVKRTTPITEAWKDLEQLGEYV